MASLDAKASANGTMTLREALKSKDLLIVDVRSNDEVAEGSYPGAKNIPISDFESRVSELGADLKRPIITYCRAGARSANCAGVAKNKGYVNCFCLANMDAVKDAKSHA